MAPPAQHSPFNSRREQRRLLAPSLILLRSLGPLGIEPNLPAPKAGVLPVYYGPVCFTMNTKMVIGVFHMDLFPVKHHFASYLIRFFKYSILDVPYFFHFEYVI